MKKKIWISATAALIIILSLAFTLTAAGKDNKLISKKVFVLDTNLENMTFENAKEKISEKYLDLNPVIKIDYKSGSGEIKFSDFAQYDFDKTVENAYKIGRKNVFSKVFRKIFPSKKELVLAYFINDKSLEKCVFEMMSNSGDAYKEESYTINEDKLTVTAGNSGKSIDIEDLKADFADGISKGKNCTVNAQTTVKNYEGVDVDKLYDKVFQKPEDAYYDKKNEKIVTHKLGYSFDKKEAKNILKNLKEGETAEIPLTVTMPKVLEEDLTGKMFKDVLYSYSTNYNPGEVDRSYNMYLAAKKVNATVIEPGGVFSYNTVVGARTVSAGYRNAKIFENGQVVDGLAGGICQVSTTIYCAALYANMGIVERTNHSFPVSYAPKGMDATVVMGSLDLKFKNTTSHPIQIVTSVSGGVCNVKILGTKDSNIKVEIINTVTGTQERPVTYEEDPSLEPGAEKVKQAGSDGYSVSTIRNVYVDSKLIKTEKLPSSRYIPLKKIILVNSQTKPEDEEEEENTEEAEIPPEEDAKDEEPPLEDKTPEELPPEESVSLQENQE